MSSNETPSNPKYPLTDKHAKTPDPEAVERRNGSAVLLESFELQAIQAFNNDESMPRVRLRLTKALAGLSEDDSPTPVEWAAGASSTQGGSVERFAGAGADLSSLSDASDDRYNGGEGSSSGVTGKNRHAGGGGNGSKR